MKIKIELWIDEDYDDQECIREVKDYLIEFAEFTSFVSTYDIKLDYEDDPCEGCSFCREGYYIEDIPCSHCRRPFFTPGDAHDLYWSTEVGKDDCEFKEEEDE